MSLPITTELLLDVEEKNPQRLDLGLEAFLTREDTAVEGPRYLVEVAPDPAELLSEGAVDVGRRHLSEK